MRRSGAIAALCAPLFVSCGHPANSLSGSLNEVAPLQFDSTQVRASPQVLVVEYDRYPNGKTDGGAGGLDVVFKMAVQIEGLQLNKGLNIDLSGRTPSGTPRAACTRAVGTDPRRDLPPIKRGELILDSDVNIGQTASGTLHVLFGAGGEVGEGRTVDGTFRAPVQDASPGSQP